MKRILFLFMFIMFTNFSEAQHESYNTLWKQVENLEIEGLPKSALKVVEDISTKAKKAENHVQFIKSMIYKAKYTFMLEEDAQLSIINDFKTEIESNEFPTKNVLENILAYQYWQYFNRNRYKFYNRTKTSTKVDSNDFRTWDLNTLFSEIHLHYQNSLQNGLMLQLEPLGKYDPILNLREDSKTYRPSLFDFLNHYALKFYKTNETQITKPAYKFEIDNPKFLGDVTKFSSLRILSRDSTSLQLNALKIYQDLIKFHLKDKSPKALTSVNIERLRFVTQHATFSKKQEILIEVLQSERDKYKNNEVSALYDFEIAYNYKALGEKYNSRSNKEARWKIKEALDLCQKVISKFPKSKGAEKCKILKKQIEQKSLQITTESFLPIQKHARVLVGYKNIDTLKFKIYKISERQYQKFNEIYDKEDKWKFISKLNVVHTWESKLRNENDFQRHSTEVLIPKLDNGQHIIVAKMEENTPDAYAYATLQVTNMALVDSETKTHRIFQIINRNNGAPIADASIIMSYFPERIRKRQTKSYSTNTLGEIKIEKDILWYRDVDLKVTSNIEVAYFWGLYLNRYYKPKKLKTEYRGFLFTDRSIYRPGQTVYFKAIAMKALKGKSDVLSNEPVYVELFNTNRETVKKLNLKTNDFGSVSGEFIIPNSGLNGRYQIRLTSETGLNLSSSTSFSVEEYKRPKFETKFEPVTETFKINDSVTVKGKVAAYAGSNITDAKVIYRVHRKVQYPRWYYWHRPHFNGEPQEITHGEGITNDKGEFEITFKALPDASVNQNNLPVFKYEVTADVTDVNGETRSATTIINVGYHALIANLSINEKLDKTRKDHHISIDTKNLNGEFVPAKGIIKIYKLKAPNRILRQRPWPAPDYQEFSKEAFKNLFPHDAYKNEDKLENWEKGDLVFEKAFNTSVSKTLKLGKIKKWDSGKYLITLESKDKFGQYVKDQIQTTLYNNDEKSLADNKLFSISTNKPSYNIEDTAQITLTSSAENIWVTVAIEKNKKLIRTEIIQLNNNKKTLRIPVNKEDLGGFGIHYSLAAYNSSKTGTISINVPYPKTDLEIETKTFRDKLQPGTDETWSFSIKGTKGDKVSAELLASMYDASLDQFKPHSWKFNPIYKPIYYASYGKDTQNSFGIKGFRVYRLSGYSHAYPKQLFDQFNWFGFNFGIGRNMISRLSAVSSESLSIPALQEEGIELYEAEEDAEVAFFRKKPLANNNLESFKKKGETVLDIPAKLDFNNIKIRKNLQETAFFFPQLKTDKDGNVNFSFTTPEALTQWKLQLLAHTKTLESATKTLSAITQKELMVTPNAPRFLREGDQITISTKITNLTEKQLLGQAILLLTDAISNKTIDVKLKNTDNNKTFIVDANGNTEVSWSLSIPDDVQAVQYKIIAKTDQFSDGEQNALPVLSNRMLVTETLPMWIKGNETRTFTLDKLKTVSSTSLKHHKLTLEITSNPAWYAVQALPYLMEYPYQCNEQTFSRYYANALASHIANSNPRIQEVFNLWKSQEALMSNLEKNQELKSIIIQETPWLRDAQSETEQKKRIALLFDLNKMNNELQSALNKLENNQMPSGAWAWFNGGRANRWITQHIITGFGHLNHLNVTLNVDEAPQNQIIKNAIKYLDAQFVKEYKNLKKHDKDVDLSKDHLSYIQLHYLYMRSFYADIKKSSEVEEISSYYLNQIRKYWLKRSLYAKGLMALVLHRNKDSQTASKILKSLKENSITSEELGMYWKSNTISWYWHQAPIETQALLIETFSEAGNLIQNKTENQETVDNLKIWLLKNKQTNRWKTTKATTDAVYGFLLQGSDWLNASTERSRSATDMVDIEIGNQKIEASKLEEVKVEAGTGYFKTSWNTNEIEPKMAEIKLTKKNEGIAWGGVYWQYFEDLDKITSAETSLTLKKKLFLKKNTDTGEEISEITSETKLKVGDLVRVRIELKSDRPMEFVHMKDMRASGLEPTNVISKYKWQDGLGYYESTKDASTNFFFDYLPKGVYVFEYDLRVNNAGNMSNGITTIQSMYAPEFSSHSEGMRISIN